MHVSEDWVHTTWILFRLWGESFSPRFYNFSAWAVHVIIFLSYSLSSSFICLFLDTFGIGGCREIDWKRKWWRMCVKRIIVWTVIYKKWPNRGRLEDSPLLSEHFTALDQNLFLRNSLTNNEGVWSYTFSLDLAFI